MAYVGTLSGYGCGGPITHLSWCNPFSSFGRTEVSPDFIKTTKYNEALVDILATLFPDYQLPPGHKVHDVIVDVSDNETEQESPSGATNGDTVAKKPAAKGTKKDSADGKNAKTKERTPKGTKKAKKSDTILTSQRKRQLDEAEETKTDDSFQPTQRRRLTKKAKCSSDDDPLLVDLDEAECEKAATSPTEPAKTHEWRITEAWTMWEENGYPTPARQSDRC